MVRTMVSAAAMLLLCGASPLPAEETARHIAAARQAACDILVDGHLAGSGCCIHPDGTGLTAAHVLGAPRTEIEVLLGNKERLPAKIVAVDMGADLALFTLPERKQPYPHLPIAPTAPVVTDEVFLIGSPIFRRGVVLRGSMASDRPNYEFAQDHYVEAVHISGPSPPGSSGGPWLNAKGELIGVQSSSVTVDGVPQGIAIVSPLSAIHRLSAARKSPRTPSLGAAVEELWGQEPAFIQRVAPGTAGLVLRQVRADGPAYQVGMREWDIVTHFDGQPVQTIEAFVEKVFGKTPGDVITLKVLDQRGKNPREIKVPVALLGAEWIEALKASREP